MAVSQVDSLSEPASQEPAVGVLDLLVVHARGLA